MVKKLVRHGNSLALILDKPVLDLLKISEETPLEVETLDGKTLHIKPVTEAKKRSVRPSVKEALNKTNKNFGKTLRNLSK